MADTIAFCWASGLIQFGDQVPEGAIEIARGDDQVVREILVTNSRHAYDNVSLLVPGLPEAANQTEGGDALECFIRLLAKYDSAAFQVAYVEDV
ncbi:host nuclease inhibitor protein [Pseudomonas aeruginosa]|uniref:host nuclease inhibitor protein n=1 Tax=Pseudomonas aeruginosa TaxID=287 RepID=UPI0039835EDE